MLARGRLATLREMAGAPASGRAMVNRTCGYANTEDSDADTKFVPENDEAEVEAEIGALTDELVAFSDEMALLAKAKANGDLDASSALVGLLAALPNDLGCALKTC